jgi:hypothetical protein
MPRRHRRAYHKAGHAVMAVRYGIHIERVGLRRSPEQLTTSIFQSADEYCPLRMGRATDERRLENYLFFLLAGSIAEMLAIEHHHHLVRCPAFQNHFRDRCYEILWARPDVHNDLAFYYFSFWGRELAPFEVPRMNVFYWGQVLRRVEEPETWQRIEQVAQQLIQCEVLDQSGILAAMEGQ